MAALGTYCFDGLNFSQASSLFTDTTLTTAAPDGFYAQGNIIRQQLNGVLLNAQPCGTCSVSCGQGLSASQSGNGYFSVNIDLANSTGAVIMYFYMGSSVPDGVLSTYNSVSYNRMTAKNNHNGVVLLNGSSTQVDYAGIDNQGTGLPTYIGNQNSALVGSYTNTPGGACSQGDKPEDFSYTGNAYVSQGTLQENFSVVNNQVGFSSDSSSITSPLFTMVIPKSATTPTSVNLIISAPMCGTLFRWEVDCPIALSNFNASAAQSTTACAAATTTYYFARNATGVQLPFVVDTNTIPEIGNFVFSDVNGSTYLNDTSTIQYYVIANTTAIGVRNGVVVSSASCSGGGGGTNTAFFGTSGTSSLADGMCNVNVANLLYHDGSGTLPQVGDTIYSGSSSSSSRVTWTDYKGFNSADVGGGAESSGTVNAAGVIQLIAICP